MDTLNDYVFLGYPRLELCHEPPTVGRSHSSLPLLHCASLSQSHAIWFSLPLLDQLGHMAGASFPQSHFPLSRGQPETGEWEKSTVQFYKERGHSADTQVGSRRAISSFAFPTFLTTQWLSSLSVHQNLLVQLLLHFPPKSSPSTTPPYGAPRHTRLSTPPFLYPDILVSPLQSIRQNSSVRKTVNHLCCCVSNLPLTIPSPNLFQLNRSAHSSPAHNIAFCFHVFPSALLHA